MKWQGCFLNRSGLSLCQSFIVCKGVWLAKAGWESGWLKRCILKKVPAVGHLHGMRQRPADGLTVSAATVLRHGLDAGMLAKPRFDRRRLTVWQKVDDLPSLEVADDGPVAVTLLPGPVVYSDDARWWRGRPLAASRFGYCAARYPCLPTEVADSPAPVLAALQGRDHDNGQGPCSRVVRRP